MKTMKTAVMGSAASHESDETQNSASSTPPITIVLPPEIIHTHILTRLDGTSLAAASSVSSYLRHLCTDEGLWRNICIATWPSLVNPIVSHAISKFPGGHRSFFSDAFPYLHYSSSHAANHHHHRMNPQSPPPRLISAIDIYCEGKHLFSKVQRIQKKHKWYLTSPFWADVVQPITNPVIDEEYLQENLSLSWIVIDPTQKRAANLSSWKPVSVERHYVISDLDVVYAVVMAGLGGSTELVRCMVTVRCCRKDGGELHVKNVNMEMENLVRKSVTGRKSVMILQRAMENGERKKVDEVGAKERFQEFKRKMMEMTEIRKEEMMKGLLDELIERRRR